MLDLVEIKEYTGFNVKGVDVMPFGVRHGDLDILGFRIGDMGYITDASKIDNSTVEALRGVKVMVINALREKRTPLTHEF